MDDSSPTSANEASPSHDTRGKFAPGNKLGRGNPLAKRQAEYRRNFSIAVTPLQMQQLAKELFRRVMEEGDMVAARLLIEYLMGKPAGAGDEAAEDGGPMLVMPPKPREKIA